MQNTEQKTALIAMSGGVDSSIAAYLMRQADFRCMGTTMRLYRNEDLGACNFRTCCSEKDIEDASEVAFQLDIPYEVLDFTLDFQEKIIGKFVRTYEAGGTPNPCIDCNRFMKFDKLLDFAEQHGLYYVVTGHYARIEQDEQTGRWLLKKGVDAGKDQSYMLALLSQEQLARLVLPLGGTTKAEVRVLAADLGLPVAEKPESQDVCFIEGDYRAFLRARGVDDRPGAIVDCAGAVLGRHDGLANYTVGQRRGIGVAAPEPYYVVAKRPETSELVVGFADEARISSVLTGPVRWQALACLDGPRAASVKLRYRSRAVPCIIEPEPEGRVRAVLREPQPTTAPGQFAVFSVGDTVLGGGMIEEVASV